jgi:hypothetical protein
MREENARGAPRVLHFGRRALLEGRWAVGRFRSGRNAAQQVRQEWGL